MLTLYATSTALSHLSGATTSAPPPSSLNVPSDQKIQQLDKLVEQSEHILF